MKTHQPMKTNAAMKAMKAKAFNNLLAANGEKKKI
jgi:hypothetical protein